MLDHVTTTASHPEIAIGTCAPQVRAMPENTTTIPTELLNNVTGGCVEGFHARNSPAACSQR